MFSRIILLVYFYVIYLYTSLTEAASVIDIHRSRCRKDTLMKATDRDKKLTATASNIISKLHEKSLSVCTMKCVKNERCVSINYKKSFANGEEKNCELLDVNKTSSSVTLSNENGWIHYEPVIQVSEVHSYTTFLSWNLFLYYQLKFTIHYADYTTYKIRYYTTNTIPRGARCHVYPVA